MMDMVRKFKYALWVALGTPYLDQYLRDRAKIIAQEFLALACVHNITQANF